MLIDTQTKRFPMSEKEIDLASLIAVDLPAPKEVAGALIITLPKVAAVLTRAVEIPGEGYRAQTSEDERALAVLRRFGVLELKVSGREIDPTTGEICRGPKYSGLRLGPYGEKIRLAVLEHLATDEKMRARFDEE